MTKTFDQMFVTDKKAEREGSWVQVDGTEIWFLLARSTNDEYIDCLEKLRRPHLNEIRKGEYPRDKQREIIRKAVARCILLGWKNLVRDGKDIKYSYDEAYNLLEHEEFLDWVLYESSEKSYYQKEYLEESAKNS